MSKKSTAPSALITGNVAMTPEQIEVLKKESPSLHAMLFPSPTPAPVEPEPAKCFEPEVAVGIADAMDVPVSNGTVNFGVIPVGTTFTVKDKRSRANGKVATKIGPHDCRYPDSKTFKLPDAIQVIVMVPEGPNETLPLPTPTAAKEQAAEIEANAKEVEAPVGTVEKLHAALAKPVKFKMTPNDRSALKSLWKATIWKSSDPTNEEAPMVEDYGQFTAGWPMAARLERAGLIMTYTPATLPDDSPPSRFKWTNEGRKLFKHFTEAPATLFDEEDPAPEPKPKTKKGEHKLPSKAAMRRADAATGENIIANASAPKSEPWLADTIPAKVCRMADKEIMTIRNVVTHGNHLVRYGIEAKDVTEEVLREAEALEHAWKGSLRDMVTMYNQRVKELNKLHGFKDEEADAREAAEVERIAKTKKPKRKDDEETTKPTKEPKADGEPKSTGKYPVCLGGDDHSMTSVIRWLGGHGYEVEHAERMLTLLEIEGVSDATIKTQIYRGAKGGMQPEAKLNKDEVEVLESIIVEQAPKKKVKSKK